MRLRRTVRLLPAADPPHKGATHADAAQRARMLDLAIAGERGLRVDRRELRREGPSYTVDTLRELRGELGEQAPIVWLVGSDSLAGLHTWHRWRELFEHAHILVVERPGTRIDADSLGRDAPDVLAEVGPRWRAGGAVARRRPAGGFARAPAPPAAARVLHRAAPPHRRRRALAGLGAGRRGRVHRPSPAVCRAGRTLGSAIIAAHSCVPRAAPLTTQAQVIKTRLPSPPPAVEDLLKTVRAALEELKAKDAVEIDVRGKSSVTDFMVIASGTSTRHVKSIANEVVVFAKKLDIMPLGVEGEREAEWVLVDLGDVVVHVMLPRVREFYALERLWTVGDQPPTGIDEYGDDGFDGETDYEEQL